MLVMTSEAAQVTKDIAKGTQAQNKIDNNNNQLVHGDDINTMPFTTLLSAQIALCYLRSAICAICADSRVVKGISFMSSHGAQFQGIMMIFTS